MLNKLKAMQDEFIQIRHEIHKNPEIGMCEFNTARIISDKLKEFGYEVYEGIANTGVVGVLKKGSSNKKISLRADMDALYINENNQCEYKSKNEGLMHACGHDGHSASLLLAAKYLADCDFNGTINLIFQPAEEGRGGANAMINDGLFDRFSCDYIFGYHNLPSKDNKLFLLKKGAMMAGASSLKITIKGLGGHGSAPEKASDVMGAMANFILQASMICSRNIAAQNSAVITFGAALCGNESSFNILQDEALLLANIRTFSKEDRNIIYEQLENIAKAIEISSKVKITLEFNLIAEATINDDEAQKLAFSVACELFKEENCDENHLALMGSEDFSFMLDKVKGAYAFINNGNSAYLHDANYDYNDEILHLCAAYYVGVSLKYLQ
ncbi:amidohydrolase [Campylobacter canadensis]|uniref:amidohydrolase n=1 Tax=Campylobacter canadensis TaxID=449520 RepID=UPI0015530EA6|nr:amidohydrolase [Campylobacter canadensis]MBZ7994468.1 amidohydrolase [Campylobacter canadensis]MBZ7996445.1 amidohydrolase [Campylobacter canadensis]MBZ7999817.1 amidohydrolase [Campylobacter canadensis]MBZ8001702.1 amidohydrolase [Campylobacter canadensis]MBZ8002951.1 amidohydrolase [Campylobacter canadensis]